MEDLVLGVVGAGVMGAGIAQVALHAKLDVILVDQRSDALVAARLRIRDGLRLERMLNGGRTPAESLARAEMTTSLGAMRRAHFVVETVAERISVKEEVFRELDDICPPSVCLASTTSAIPIARLASVTGRAPRVLGLHFMNPVPMIRTVELIRAAETDDSTVGLARALLASLGRTHVEVRDGTGSVSNRALMLTINEAVAALADNLGRPADIDRIFTSCLGHRSGPLACADTIGLDVVVDTMCVLSDLAGSKYQPHPLLAELVQEGRLGRKTGRGFFEYTLSA
jgi:3-hydroxyacyl-CoA dehydrogenase